MHSIPGNCVCTTMSLLLPCIVCCFSCFVLLVLEHAEELFLAIHRVLLAVELNMLHEREPHDTRHNQISTHRSIDMRRERKRYGVCVSLAAHGFIIIIMN